MPSTTRTGAMDAYIATAPGVGLQIYKATQECLSNALRRPGATHITGCTATVSATSNRPDAERMSGCGFAPETFCQMLIDMADDGAAALRGTVMPLQILAIAADSVSP